MFTLHKLGRVVQSLADVHITKAKRRRFHLGIELCAFREFTSLNSAGRLLGIGRFTGEARMRRMAHDNALGDSLQRMLLHEGFSRAMLLLAGSFTVRLFLYCRTGRITP
jgi:hypothetical protein